MNCSNCGNPLPEGTNFCTACGQMAQEKRGNMLLGTLGALLGAIIGGVSIVIFSQLGYVAALSGLILAVCTLKGYELLGKKLTTPGLVICVVLMLVTPFVADWINWALVVMEAWADYGVTFVECALVLPDLMAEGVIETSAYLKNLGMLYLFVILGAGSTLSKAFKK